MPKVMPVEPRFLRATVTGRPVGVDRDKKIIRGYVVAQAGDFKTPGRGAFDLRSLQTIVGMMNKSAAGLKSRFAHPTLSDDGLGKFLGRSKNARLDGDQGRRVRADLHLDPTSFKTPHGDLGTYVMELAESDPDALSSSLVLMADDEERVDAKGKPLVGEDGEPVSPIWRPTKLHASDIVDTGDAVDGLLSAETLPDAAVRQGCELLDRVFSGQPWEVVEARCLAWLGRYREHRGEASFVLATNATRPAHMESENPAPFAYKLQLEELSVMSRKFGKLKEPSPPAPDDPRRSVKPRQ